tara:strand:+ start:156 stop:314 length:159 start_codon:yes stop_codon:yes gene_type:complete
MLFIICPDEFSRVEALQLFGTSAHALTELKISPKTLQACPQERPVHVLHQLL